MSRRFDCTDVAQRTRGLAQAVAALTRGELVVLPTDTVYGIAADAFSPTAVDALLAAKGRGRDMPVPVLISSRQMLDGVVDNVPPVADALVAAFWPGALTVVMRHTPALAWDLGDARGTVAVRMPQHSLTLDLIEATGPLAVSSANRTGQPAATDADQAEAQLGDLVGVLLDDGPTSDAVPSSIVDVTGEQPRLLRAGAIDVDQLREVVPTLVGPE